MKLSGPTSAMRILSASACFALACLPVVADVTNCVPHPSGLVGWWRAEGSAVDQVGTNHGSVQNGGTFAAGGVGSAFSFDGSNDYVKVPKSPALDFGSQLTIEFWMKADASNPMNTIQGLVASDFYTIEISSGLQTRMGVNFGISLNNGGFYHQTADANGGGAVVSPGEWHHVAGTYDGAQLCLYIDGQPWGNPRSASGTISPMLANSFVTFGSEDGRTVCGNCVGTRYFKGLLDEVSLYNRALSAAEIAAIYNAAVAGKCTDSTSPFFFIHPTNRVVATGDSAAFSAVAGGTPPLIYQWQFNGTNIAGATATLLTLTNIQPQQDGVYTLQVTNPHGFATSSNAVLAVDPLLPCVPAPSHLAGWWRAEGNVADRAGTNHGILLNGASLAAGKVSVAFDFDGINDYVKIPRSPSLDFGNQLTIEFWMKADASNPMNTIQGLVASDFYAIEISSGLQSRMGVNFGISFDNGAFFHQTADSNGGGEVISSGEWHHVAGTYNGAELQLFIDGQACGNPRPASGTISPMLANSFVTFGSEDGRTYCGNCVGRRYFKGLLDEVSIYNRALSATEVAAIYNAAHSGKCDPTPPFILIQPTNRAAFVGDAASFAVLAGGTATLVYQWQFNGTNLAGAAGPTLNLTNIQTEQAGVYTLLITNEHGTVVSTNAWLSVNPRPYCVPVSSGLVSWWRAEGGAVDQIGTNHGALLNGAALATGQVGNAFSFDGVNDHVKIPRSPSLDFSNQLTVEFWMKADASNPMNTIQGLVTSDFYAMEISSGWQTRMGVNFAISFNNGGLYYHVGDVNGGGAVVSPGEWHHVASTYDGAQLQLYIDGQPWGNPHFVSGTISPMLPNSFLSLGSEDGRTVCGNCAGKRYFKGLLDEVAIYNRALSAAEIAAIYNAAVAGKCTDPTPPFIFAHPAGQTAELGSNVTFAVCAGGMPTPAYQWRFNGNPIADATRSSLVLPAVQLSAAGHYSAVVSNQFDTLTTSNAQLSVVGLHAYANGQRLTNAVTRFDASATIQLVNFFPNGRTFYTLDGTPPTFGSKPYTGPFGVTHSAVLRALAYSADFMQSYELEPRTLLITPAFALTGTTSGGGSVALNPPGGVYLSNTVVSVTAQPATGWTFLQWLGDLDGTNAGTTITLNRNKHVQAVFGTTLNTTVAGSGTVTLDPPGGVYPYGSVVRLMAAPQPGNYFGLWGNAASGNANPLFFTLTNANPTVSSLFAALGGSQAALTVRPEGSGRVTVAPQANVYALNTGVTLTAIPDAGQSFLGWSGDAGGSANPLGLTLSQSKVITAQFSTRPRLTVNGPLAGRVEEGFRFALDGALHGHYQVEVSTNLQNWDLLVTLTNDFGRMQFTDSGGTNEPVRFYRAQELP